MRRAELTVADNNIDIRAETRHRRLEGPVHCKNRNAFVGILLSRATDQAEVSAHLGSLLACGCLTCIAIADIKESVVYYLTPRDTSRDDTLYVLLLGVAIHLISHGVICIV